MSWFYFNEGISSLITIFIGGSISIVIFYFLSVILILVNSSNKNKMTNKYPSDNEECSYKIKVYDDMTEPFRIFQKNSSDTKSSLEVLGKRLLSIYGFLGVIFILLYAFNIGTENIGSPFEKRCHQGYYYAEITAVSLESESKFKDLWKGSGVVFVDVEGHNVEIESMFSEQFSIRGIEFDGDLWFDINSNYMIGYEVEILKGEPTIEDLMQLGTIYD